MFSISLVWNRSLRNLVTASRSKWNLVVFFCCLGLFSFWERECVSCGQLSMQCCWLKNGGKLFCWWCLPVKVNCLPSKFFFVLFVMFLSAEGWRWRGGAFNLLGPTPPPPFFFPIQSSAHVSPEPWQPNAWRFVSFIRCGLEQHESSSSGFFTWVCGWRN